MKRLLFTVLMFACLGAGCASTTVLPKPVPKPVAPPPSGVEGRRCVGPTDSTCGVGYECAQDCGPPVVRADEPPPGYSCHAAGKPRMCPICLASNTMIATPNGDVNIKDVKIGMSVWTQNDRGMRLSGKVIRLSKTPVSKTHQMVQLVLSDKRMLWVSPGHPMANGKAVGELRVGSTFDGARVVSVDLVPYWDDFTYDLLTDGGSGNYWANGVLMGSTLFGK